METFKQSLAAAEGTEDRNMCKIVISIPFYTLLCMQNELVTIVFLHCIGQRRILKELEKKHDTIKPSD